MQGVIKTGSGTVAIAGVYNLGIYIMEVNIPETTLHLYYTAMVHSHYTANTLKKTTMQLSI